MNVAIIGAGASGLMAGGALSQQCNVTIFDGNEKCGKKLYITGKGRCNVTNNCDKKTFLENAVNGNKFLISSINYFQPQDTIRLFEELGVKLKTERGNRVFPESDKSSDIIKALIKYCEKCEIRLNEKVVQITKKDEHFLVKTKKSSYIFDRVIIATGGMSYPFTGSTGDGYRFARELGQSVVSVRPALVPIKLKDAFCKQVEGLSLKNVTLKANIDGKKKELFGELLFTNDAISGPISLSMSSFIGNAKSVKLEVDFKSALSNEQLEQRLLRDFEGNKNKNITYILKGLLPGSLVNEFCQRLSLSKDKKVNSITKEERKNIIDLLKSFPLEFAGLYDIECGIITAGGVDTKEINPRTMESKLVPGLYFIGEVLDVDCLTGGFNLQAAFSTAQICAKNFN